MFYQLPDQIRLLPGFSGNLLFPLLSLLLDPSGFLCSFFFSPAKIFFLLLFLDIFLIVPVVNGKRPVFYAVGPNGDRGENMNAYNTALRRYVLNYKSSYVKYTHVADCLAGSRGGFLSDDTYYNNATLKKIITKFKRLA